MMRSTSLAAVRSTRYGLVIHHTLSTDVVEKPPMLSVAPQFATFLRATRLTHPFQTHQGLDIVMQQQLWTKKIYLFGGTGASGSIVDEVDVFDTLMGKWTTLTARMPNATTDLSAFAHAGKIYTLGGYDASWTALKLTQIFNPVGGSPWQKGSPLVQGRGDAFAGVVGNKAYVVGGFHHENNFESPVSSMEMLDLGAGAAWATRMSMKVTRGDKAVAVLNNILHVVGGETKNAKGHSVPLKDVEAYDPVGNAWYFGGDIPTERFRFVAASHGNSIFIFGGQGYLTGEHGADGSKYPLVDTVEEYSETVTVGSVVGKAGGLPGPILVVLATLLLSMQAHA